MPQYARLISVTATLDTNAYGSGDLVADTQEIPDAIRIPGNAAILQSVMIIDEDDQTASAYDLYILDQNVSMGTENSAPSITDANARAILGAPIAIATANWKDIGGAKINGVDNINKIVTAASGTSLYFAIVNGAGTPTFTASGLKLRFGFQQY